MYAGEKTAVSLSVDKSLIGVIADRFGQKVFIHADSENENRFILKVDVNISNQFFGWLFALGDGVKLLSPAGAAEAYRAHCEKVLMMYREVKG
jgi:hypothetical protein